MISIAYLSRGEHPRPGRRGRGQIGSVRPSLNAKRPVTSSPGWCAQHRAVASSGIGGAQKFGGPRHGMRLLSPVADHVVVHPWSATGHEPPPALQKKMVGCASLCSLKGPRPFKHRRRLIV